MGFVLVAATLLATSELAAQGRGFAVSRLTPTAAGEWSFSVDQPWYSGTELLGRRFAAGLTLDYAHQPLVVGLLSSSGFVQSSAIVNHQLLAHVDVAAAFFDRLQLSASLPVVLAERGEAAAGSSPSGAGVGDPSVGVLVRVLGRPVRDRASLHVGARLWVPVGREEDHAGDPTVRVEPKVVVTGLLLDRVQWAFNGGWRYRATESIGATGAADGIAVGSELRLGAAVYYLDRDRAFNVGSEVTYGTVVSDGHAFDKSYSALELLGAAHVSLARRFNVGVAAGPGFFQAPGVPDVRALLRLAYAPLAERPRAVVVAAPEDFDRDGINDSEDSCPREAGDRSADPRLHGCPKSPDGDGDGVPDDADQCVFVAAGLHPDGKRPGCPLTDVDGDGVWDTEDACTEVAAGAHPDPLRPGCPQADTDGDGLVDGADACPTIAMSGPVDPTKRGCPAVDTDNDGVFDFEDQCPQWPAGLHPDPKRRGCALADADGDSVPDELDVCPGQKGAPSLDPKKHGCPGLVTVQQGQIKILKPVFFSTNREQILAKSFPVLLAVADALAAAPEVKKVEIAGHTDDRGNAQKNLELSDRRATSVMQWLLAHGVGPARLAAKGYGSTEPIASNRTARGRSENRRVEFRILDPAGTRPMGAEPAGGPPR
jgi:outer membrane protein OmpA-like peptidoglycan-associated protein